MGGGGGGGGRGGSIAHGTHTECTQHRMRTADRGLGLSPGVPGAVLWAPLTLLSMDSIDSVRGTNTPWAEDDLRRMYLAKAQRSVGARAFL